MMKAIISKVLLDSILQNGSEWKKSGRQTRETWYHGSGWDKKRPQYSDSIRDEVEANDIKILRYVFVQKEHLKDYKKEKSWKRKYKCLVNTLKEYFNLLALKDIIYKNNNSQCWWVYSKTCTHVIGILEVYITIKFCKVIRHCILRTFL